jgi:hypothetical protein
MPMPIHTLEPAAIMIVPTSHAASPPQAIAISQPADEVQAGDIIGMDTSLRAAFEMIAHQQEVMVHFLGDDLAGIVFWTMTTFSVALWLETVRRALKTAVAVPAAHPKRAKCSHRLRMRNVVWQLLLLLLLLLPLQQQEQQPRKPVCSAI